MGQDLEQLSGLKDVLIIARDAKILKLGTLKVGD